MKPLLILLVVVFLVACSSTPDRVNYPPIEEPRVEIRALFAKLTAQTYERLLADYRERRVLPPRDPELVRACAGFPPPLPVEAHPKSQAAIRAEQCGGLAAALRLRAEIDSGAIPCSPLDSACALRRVRAEVERASGSRFAGKTPECAEFVFRYREWHASSPDWGTCQAFSLFESLQLESSASWNASEFRACLAPHVPTFPSIAACLPPAPSGTTNGEQSAQQPGAQTLVGPQDIAVAARDLMSLLRSDAVLCSGFLGETRLAKADGLRRWASLAASADGARVRDAIASSYGAGALERALRDADTSVSEFRSELCIASE